MYCVQTVTGSAPNYGNIFKGLVEIEYVILVPLPLKMQFIMAKYVWGEGA